MKRAARPASALRLTRPTKPGRARKRVTDRPPPESGILRDRAAPHESTFVDGPSSSDALAERMGEDAVEAITSGEDEAEIQRGDGDGERVVEAAVREDHLFDSIDDEDEDEETEEDEAS